MATTNNNNTTTLSSEERSHMVFFSTLLPTVMKIQSEDLLKYRDEVSKITFKYGYPGREWDDNPSSGAKKRNRKAVDVIEIDDDDSFVSPIKREVKVKQEPGFIQSESVHSFENKGYNQSDVVNTFSNILSALTKSNMSLPYMPHPMQYHPYHPAAGSAPLYHGNYQHLFRHPMPLLYNNDQSFQRSANLFDTELGIQQRTTSSSTTTCLTPTICQTVVTSSPTLQTTTTSPTVTAPAALQTISFGSSSNQSDSSRKDIAQ